MTSSDLSRKEGLALFYHRLIEAWKYTMAHLNCIGEGFHLVEECQVGYAKPRFVLQMFFESFIFCCNKFHIQVSLV